LAPTVFGALARGRASGGVYGLCDDLFDSENSLWFGRSGDFPTSFLVGSAGLNASEDVFVKPGFNFNMETWYDGTGGTVYNPGDEYESCILT